VDNSLSLPNTLSMIKGLSKEREELIEDNPNISTSESYRYSARTNDEKDTKP
jgi:hypothetical protein